jgi:putative Mg2+ transporter-C (MgtC) family protein
MEILPEDIQKILLSTLIGGLIGAEREYWSKSAGFRTIILITLGSTIFTILSFKIGGDHDPVRIAANIITGIGFLGAGVIFREEDRVSGLTTATVIWVSASIGMAIGFGHYLFSFLGFVIVAVVLTGFRYLQLYIDKVSQIRKYKIVCYFKQKTLVHYEELFKKYNLSAKRGKQSRVGNEIIGCWEVHGTVANHELVTEKLLNDEEVKEFDF